MELKKELANLIREYQNWRKEAGLSNIILFEDFALWLLIHER